MTRSLAMLALVFYSVISLHAETAPQLYSIAAEAYKAKNYQQAIDAYQKLLTEGYRNADVYYNLGNAYYKSDQISLSILNYERALRLAPADEDIRFNLKLANLKAVDRITPVPQLFLITQWHRLLAAFSSRSWAIIAVISAWLALAAFALYLFVGSARTQGFYAGITLIFFCFFFVYLSYAQHQAESGAGQAILTATNTYMKSAPDTSGTDLFIIHEGAKLNILDRVGTWSKVRLADGKVGWVEQQTYTVI